MAEEGTAAAPGAAAEKVIHTYPVVRMKVLDEHSDLQSAYWKDKGEDAAIEAEPRLSLAAVVKHSDMSEEMRTEAVELSVTACEKFSQNNEHAARMIKEAMDKKFGPAFHVVVGESYGFELTYECTTICYIYFGGNQAICIWKCS